MANDQEKSLISTWTILASEYAEQLKGVDKETIKVRFGVFRQILSDIPPEIVMAAARQHISTNQYFPHVSEIRRIALELMAPRLESAEDAWISVVRAVREHGSYEYPCFENERTAHVVRVMGWDCICSSSEEWNRNNFIRIYTEFSEREKTERLLLPESKEIIKRLTAGIGEQRQLRAVK